MKRNVGSIDRVLRGVIGIVILIVGVMLQSWWGGLGLIPLITAIVGWCPPYALFGISTCKLKTD